MLRPGDSGGQRAPELRCDPIRKGLAAYVAAAGATCVGLLAAALPAKADIVYTPAHVLLNDSGVGLDLNHDGIKEIRIHQSFTDFKGFGLSATALLPSARLVGNGTRFARPFKSGSLIGGSRHPWVKGGVLAGSYGGVSDGYWVDAKNRYLGLKILIKGEIHYGWARLSVQGAGHAALLTGYAYDTIANETILAGQTHALTEDAATPASGALGLLALGSLGLGFRKRQDGNTV